MSNSTSERPTAPQIMSKLGLEPDPWQIDVLETRHKRLLLNCCRQAGKSTVVALLSLYEAFAHDNSLILLLSRSLRQSRELFRRVTEFHEKSRDHYLLRKSFHEMWLTNGSRIACLPCKGDTIRGFAKVHMLVIDEAARVPDDLYRTVRPMLAVSEGRLICLSTPYGKRGFFYDAWAKGGADWARIEVPAPRIPRIQPEFLEEERRGLGESWFRQEYHCSFEALEGLVYPDFKRCVIPGEPGASATGGSATGALAGRPVGGIDFGFRNPFAAVWGVVDRDDTLWLTGEHYCRNRPLSYHIKHLPRNVRWYADPAGAGEIDELRCAGFTISKGDNALRPGIAAVSARLEDRSLRIVEGKCPNLLAEAELYRYSTEAEDKRAETPVDDNNHALAALRYLISQLDAGKLGRREPMQPSAAEKSKKLDAAQKKWMSWRNEALWTRLF
jgi:hypothetical protein